jgi:proteasome beta subunit
VTSRARRWPPPRGIPAAGWIVVHRVPSWPTPRELLPPDGRGLSRRPPSTPARDHDRRVTFDDGVVMAGDRRATMGNVIANRDIEKVFAADEFTRASASPARAGLAIELVRLFQVELEHYEKIEGTQMSLEGKANRLASMIRGNLGMAMQGLAWCRCSPATTSAGHGAGSSPTTSPAAATRSTTHHSVGSGSLLRAGRDQEALPPNRHRDTAVRTWVLRGPVRRRRRRLRHRRPGPRPADLARWWPSSSTDGFAGGRGASSTIRSHAWSAERDVRPDGASATREVPMMPGCPSTSRPSSS